jgi:mono/diheme cytochrome c family protein
MTPKTATMKKLKLLACFAVLATAFFQCTNAGSDKISSASVAAGVGSLIQKTADDSNIKHGEYLAWHVAGCMDCHSKRDFSKFSAPVVPGTEGMGGERFGPEFGLPGNIFAKNITPAGIGQWTDEELIRAMTTGINKNGDTLFPIMPYLSYSRMAKQDLLDIVKYIRTLKPIENTIPPRQLFIPIAMAIPPQLPRPDLDKNPVPDPSDKVKYGEYLVNIGSCSDCHTPREKGAPVFSRYLAGGNSFATPGFKVLSANITPDKEGGIGTWTEQMFLQKFKVNSSDDYVNRDPGKNNSIMPWSLFGKMKEDDLKAIYAYLKTVPPQKGKISPWQ